MINIRSDWKRRIKVNIEKYFKENHSDIWLDPEREKFIDRYYQDILLFFSKLKGRYTLNEYLLILDVILNTEDN